MSGAVTLIETLAVFLRERPGRWIDGRELATVAGAYAWRTRLSDLRRAPFFMRIDNRQRRVKTATGDVFVVSEYIYLGERISAAGAGLPAQLQLREANR